MSLCELWATGDDDLVVRCRADDARGQPGFKESRLTLSSLEMPHALETMFKFTKEKLSDPRNFSKTAIISFFSALLCLEEEIFQG